MSFAPVRQSEIVKTGLYNFDGSGGSCVPNRNVGLVRDRAISGGAAPFLWRVFARIHVTPV